MNIYVQMFVCAGHGCMCGVGIWLPGVKGLC